MRSARTSLVAFAVVGVAAIVAVFAFVLPALSDDKNAAPTTGTHVRSSFTAPSQLGPYLRLANAELEPMRAATLAGMASSAETADRFVEFYGTDATVVVVLKVTTGTFRPGPELFAAEQLALAGDGRGTLTGTVDRRVGPIAMKCDGAVMPDGTLTMCLHAVDGLLVEVMGFNLDTDTVATLAAEAVRRI